MTFQAHSIRAVAFDLDGTLVDTLPDLAASVARMLESLGAPALPHATVKGLIGHGVENLVQKSLAVSLGETAARSVDAANAMTLFRRFYGRDVFTLSSLFPGVEQALRTLAAAGLPMCCITNKDGLFALPILAASGIGARIAFTLTPERPEERKPAPALLLQACARLSVTAHEMLYVGDSKVDVRAARAVGCPVVIVAGGYDRSMSRAERDTLTETPDAFIDSMEELPALLESGPLAGA